MASFGNNCFSFVNQPQGLIGASTPHAFVVDTSMPPPNVQSNTSMQSGLFQSLPNLCGPQHISTGSHVSPHASPFPTAPTNYVRSSMLITSGYEAKPPQNSPPVWINNPLDNKFLSSNQHMFANGPSAPIPHAIQNCGSTTVQMQNQPPPRCEPKQCLPVWNSNNAFNHLSFGDKDKVSNHTKDYVFASGSQSPSLQPGFKVQPPQTTPPVWINNVHDNKLLVTQQPQTMFFNEKPPSWPRGTQMSGCVSTQLNIPSSLQFSVNPTEIHPPIWINNNEHFGNSNQSLDHILPRQLQGMIDNHNQFNNYDGNVNRFKSNCGSQSQMNTYNQSDSIKFNNITPNNQLNSDLFNGNMCNNDHKLMNNHGDDYVGRLNNVQNSQQFSINNFGMSNRNSTDYVPSSSAPKELFQNRKFINKCNNSFQYQSKFRSLSDKNFNTRTQNRDQMCSDTNKDTLKSNGISNRSFAQINNQNLIDIQVTSNNGHHENLKNSAYDSPTSSSSGVKVFVGANFESISSNFSDCTSKNKFQNSNRRYWDKDEGKAVRNKTWMSENIRIALRKRNLLRNRAEATKDPAVWEEYEILRDQINDEIKEAKSKSDTAVEKFSLNNERQDKGKTLPFSCDTCDRSYATDAEFKEHCALHTKCNYSGCQFEAHPKVVALHKRMQHDTGYAEVINKLQNNEEIEKWREERRRRFPTAENILKRKAEQAEKEARGEVVEDSDFRQFKRQKFGQNDWKESHFNRGSRNPRHRNRSRHPFHKARVDSRFRSIAMDRSDSEEESECHIKLPKFFGIGKGLEISVDIEKEATVNDEVVDINLTLATDEKSVSEEHVNPSKEHDNFVAPSQSGNLQPLVTSSDPHILMEDQTPGLRIMVPTSNRNDDNLILCGSTTGESLPETRTRESDDESPDEIPISKMPLNDNSKSLDEIDDLVSLNEDQIENDKTQMEVLSSRTPLNDINNEPNDKEKVISPHDSKDNDNDKRRKYQRDPRGRKPQYIAPRKNTLLEMLLAGEIKHERNVIMQCIRHIVRSKFFGIGSDVCNTL